MLGKNAGFTSSPFWGLLKLTRGRCRILLSSDMCMSGGASSIVKRIGMLYGMPGKIPLRMEHPFIARASRTRPACHREMKPKRLQHAERV